MTLPLLRPPLRGRSGLCFAAALLLLAFAAAAGPARAETSDPYTATVSVDATGDTVIKAREAARLDGQRRALTAVVEHLAGTSTPPKLPKLDDKAITDLVASFAVAKERMSAVRYLAEYTFRFRPDRVKQLMRNAGIAVASEASKPPTEAEAQAKPPQTGKPAAASPVVVIPLYQSGGKAQLWEDPNPWRAAWEQQSAAGKIVVPLGDAGDLAAIDADKARTGDAAAVASLARHNDSTDAAIATAALQGPADKPTGVTLSLRRYHAGELVDSSSAPLSAKPGESVDDLLRRAVTSSIAEIASAESGWKKATPAGYDQVGSLTAVLPISSLDDWVHARQRIAGLPAIRNVSLMALSREEATIEIGYSGTVDQLKASLAGISLDLEPGGATWHLTRAGSGASGTP